MRKTILFTLGILLLGTNRIQAQKYPEPGQPKTYSVLSLGPCLKIALDQDGIYRIRYEDLSEKGFLTQPVPCHKLAVYGNQSGLLPFYNTEGTYDDLAHLPLSVYDQDNDGYFGPGDFFLFYGESQNRWTYRDGSLPAFSLEKNPFSDSTYYFVGTHAEYTPEIPQKGSSGSALNTVSSYPDRILHETDRYNLCHGGVNWFGEQFLSDGASLQIEMPAPGAVDGRQALMFVQTAAQTSNGSASFRIRIAGNDFTIAHTASGSDLCSRIGTGVFSFPLSENTVSTQFTYNKSSTASGAYIDRIVLHYERKLELSSGSLNFRSPEAIAKDTRFRINSPVPIRVWDVSDIYNIEERILSSENGLFSFGTEADNRLHEYVAFDPYSCPVPALGPIVQAQNLHGKKNIGYVIVSHPLFLPQAKEIARLHRERSGYSTLAVSTEEVYNEFSSGAKDPSAIRLLMKKLKENSDSSQRPRYLCLFGAASYDYRNLSGTVSDFVPTVESFSNLTEGGGDPLEDNFGYLDSGEGISPANNKAIGELDIAVGRIPVRTSAEAEAALQKIDIYSNPGRIQTSQGSLSSNFGNWRNEVAFVTDDSFENSMETSILRSDDFRIRHPEFHIDKFYSDAYVRSSSSTSTRVPELENDIRERIEEGCFFMGYVGHSGWDSWSDEKILTNNIVDNLKSSHAFPIMTSSSCSFAYFDQIGQVSGAERLVLKEQGGAIAVMATSRTALVGAIEDIQSRFLYALTDKSTGIPAIGDAYLKAKTENTQSSGHKFVLLGDPGLKAALPKNSVKTLKINGKEVHDPDIGLDTLKALGTVEIEGCVTDPSGSMLTGFDGEVFVQVYDKPIRSKTLGLYNSRDGVNNPQVSYTQQNSLIFQGSTQVQDGRFQLSFMVPKDIQYDYGPGKICYYAFSDQTDANGSLAGIPIGGFDENAVPDTTPPIVELHIDSPDFHGQTVGKTPVLYAEISDRFGINTTGSGIGHDMILILDGNEKDPVVVNNRFQYDLGSYTKGSLSYPLDLPPGNHTAELKVWNINNISATASIAFRIDASDRLRIFDPVLAPNPNRGDHADFYFNHNGEAGCIENCRIYIFDLRGSCLAKLEYDLSGHNGHSVGPLRWDISGSGTCLQAGIYACRIQVTDAAGNTAWETVKLVVTGIR